MEITGIKQESEKDVERYLCEAVKTHLGGLCLKYTSNSYTGYPDRLLVLPSGQGAWVELKGTKGRLSPLQQIRLVQLRRLGWVACVCNSRKDVDALVEQFKIKAGRNKAI